MARNLGFLVLILSVIFVCEAVIFHPISESHRFAALELFTPHHGSFGSLEEASEALRTFEILGIGKDLNVRDSTCPSVVDTLGSSSSSLKDLFYALRVNKLLKCEINEEVFAGIVSKLKASIHEANSLLDFYYSIGSLRLIKDQTSEVDVFLVDADEIFKSIKALSQSDGRWHYSSNNPASSTYAAGLALETLAGVVSLATSEIDQSLLPGAKILGLAKFFLGIGIPGNAKDFYNQIDALACLESNRVSIPLILSLPATVLSLTREDQLKVRVNTVLGSAVPPLSVKLMQAFSSGSKDASIIESQELKFDQENDVHFLDAWPKSVDVGNYVFVFEIVLQDSEHKKIYATGGRTKIPIYVTRVIKVDNAEIAVLDSDIGSIESQKKLDLAGEPALALSANHLQKLRLSFQLTTPLGHSFKPHQAFLKLRHETKVEHIFVLGNSGKQFEITLENSYLRELGHIELDLPEPPEKATRPPPQAVDPYLRYGPKAEITHIFRSPEKRPPQELSLAFLALVFLPFLGFLVGLLRLGMNLKNFPTATVSTTFAILFHLGIAAVLSLYVLFWLKLDLFTSLKALSFLGIFLMFVGHKTLSHLASTSAKLKSA
ncbi:Dolichyl-diphosphooligosaccharide--protein glycosyltransferase subunit 2 [Camellia lanceoleosa]|uniref:Dolichyl-diphosphooligosaccharide--protein glycosyltransferase subunit 2 n=1 Tax=Camellia lanceoleosa TaxID=1840588 RepID=A0ACC0G3X0_9ERIC|nr:Dolichyl-diphosphooligosaccharide--protein glycosyltransferase subunit 2 [Camellia lanceoleosa]